MAKGQGRKPRVIPWGESRRRSVVHAPTIKVRRLALGLTQRDVAKGSGITDPSVCAAERGREVVLTTALKLARFFGVTVEELWQCDATGGK